MYFDPDKLDSKGRYKLLSSTVVPRPIAWVVTRSGEGKLNAAPFSYFNLMANSPPVIALGMGPRGNGAKDTARNIRETGEFVINLVPFSLVNSMNATATEFDAHIDEIHAAGLTTQSSIKVAPPRIAESPVALECKVLQTIDLGEMRSVVLAMIVGIHIEDESMLDAERLYVDTPKLDLIGRMHAGGWYSRTADQFEVNRIAVADWPCSSLEPDCL